MQWFSLCLVIEFLKYVFISLRADILRSAVAVVSCMVRERMQKLVHTDQHFPMNELLILPKIIGGGGGGQALLPKLLEGPVGPAPQFLLP